MITFKPTKKLAAKVLKTVDAGLCRGVGTPEPGEMCVEAAVCYAMGLPHGDNPTCVSHALRSLKIRLNDSNWSSNAARAKGLRRLAIAQLGSADTLDEKAFTDGCVKIAIGKVVPRALRIVAKMNPKHAEKLEQCAKDCEQNPTGENASKAKYAARAADAAAYAAYAYAAYASAARAADAAAYAAARAADAAAARAADAAAARAADAARDEQLALFAEEVVQLLIELKAPGCKYLFLTEA
jgi:hypothetical protein